VKDWKFHCAVLGVRENANAKEVRRAYRRLALERHPDKHHNSQRATEEFQQLVESYNFVLEGILEGRRPSPTPPNAPSPQQPSPPPRHASHPEAPAQRRANTPARFQPKRKAWVVWAQAAAAGFVLLSGSVAFELWNRHAGPGRHDRRDLSQQAICLAQAPGAKDNNLGYSTEAECRGRCLAQAHSTCSWNGNVIGEVKPETPVPAPAPAPNPIDEVDARVKEGDASSKPVAVCHISTVTARGLVGGLDDKTIPILSCRRLCDGVLDKDSSNGVFCKWGTEILTDRKPRIITPEDARPWVPPRPNPADDPLLADGNAATTCLMTVVSEGNSQILTFENETEQSCAIKCADQMQATWHAEVQCFYAGQSIGRHFPDAAQEYVEKNPEAAAILSYGSGLRTCLITGTANGKAKTILLKMADFEECSAHCRQVARGPASTGNIECLHDGKTFGP
jgi:hypothetical protein